MQPPNLSARALHASLELAADAIRRLVLGEEDASLRGDAPGAGAFAPHDTVEEIRDAFVTVRRGEQLAGCIGRLGATTPLSRLVAELAVSASSEDSRFDPLTASDLPTLEIELSVLSPREPIEADAFEPGRHGLVLEWRGRRGLLLPQVATEHGLDRHGFLAVLCEKAGAPLGAWAAADARLHAFEVQRAHARYVDLVRSSGAGPASPSPDDESPT